FEGFELGRLRARRTGSNVADEVRAGGRAVRPPELAAVHAVVGGEDRSLAEGREIQGIRRQAGLTAAVAPGRTPRLWLRVDVQGQLRAGFRAIARPQLAAVDPVVRREHQETLADHHALAG